MPLPPPASPNVSQNATPRRARSAARAAAAGAGQRAAVPGDVTLMNVAASSVFVLAVLGSMVALVLWLMRSPLFPLREITVEGDFTRNSVATVRAAAGPMLAGNFFSLDLQRGRAAFESVPWVRRAVVRRVWPGTLHVRLEEHRAAALWEGSAEGGIGGDSDKLVNTHGEVFQANVGDVEDDALPRLAGPEGSAAQMLALYRRLQPAFESTDMLVERLVLTQRGSWRVELDKDAVVELGRGTDDEVVARSERFVRTLPQVAARWNQPLAYADLRHADGYALRLRGVSTTEPGAAPGKAKPN